MLKFKRVLTQRELARTGRRSAIMAGAPLQVRKVRPIAAAKGVVSGQPWMAGRR